MGELKKETVIFNLQKGENAKQQTKNLIINGIPVKAQENVRNT